MCGEKNFFRLDHPFPVGGEYYRVPRRKVNVGTRTSVNCIRHGLRLCEVLAIGIGWSRSPDRLIHRAR